MRRHFFRRIAIVLAAFFVFVVTMGWLSVALFHGGPRATGGRTLFPGFFLALLALVGFVAFGRAVRRTAKPIGDVMDAASRVAGGDYSARAPIRGPAEVRELAVAFNEMADRVEAIERQRRDLIADVTHELRTPLAVIQGRIEGMLDGVYGADEEHLSLVAQQTGVLARLLDDLQLLSKAEAHALTLDREPMDPRELVEAAVAAYGGDADAHGITLRSETVDAGVPIVDVDRVRIGEVLSNLVTNALRYTPAGGTIIVSATPIEAGVAIAVTDTGPGIAADRLPHLFERFSKSPESRGAGLGLAIARSLVQAHGGSIGAESDPSGTTIRFVLPAGRR